MPHFIRCIIPNENKEAGTNTPSSVTFVYVCLRLFNCNAITFWELITVKAKVENS